MKSMFFTFLKVENTTDKMLKTACKNSKGKFFKNAHEKEDFCSDPTVALGRRAAAAPMHWAKIDYGIFPSRRW